MPRRKNPDAPTVPKAPRIRKKKADQEVKPEAVYEPIIPNSGIMMDEIYTTQDYGYAFGSQPPPHFASPEPANSPYLLPPQSNTPQPNIMMRQMATPQHQPPPSGPPGTMPPPSGSQPMGPAPTPLEFRLHDMNRRIFYFNSSGISEKDHSQWWDAFSHEFFDDDAKMMIVLSGESSETPEFYILGRQLIPRFFRTFFESGVREFYYIVRGSSRESMNQNGTINFDNDNVLQVTKHDSPFAAEVQTECKLYIEFTPYDETYNHRIRSWRIEYRSCQEYFYNDISKEYEQITSENLDRQPLTRLGLSLHTIQVLNMCKILEPMQQIMSASKSTPSVDPRETFKLALFHFHQRQTEIAHHQQMITNRQQIMPAVEETKPKAQRKRQRKANPNAKNKKNAANVSPAPPNPTFAPTAPPSNFSSAMGFQDVMVVGEPSMMGGEYGEEDERTISRVENSQYDPNALQQLQQQNMGSGGSLGMSGMSGQSNMGSNVPRGVPGGNSMGPPVVSGVPMSQSGPTMGPGGPQMGHPALHPGSMGMSMPGGMGAPGMQSGPQLTQLGPQNGHPPQGYNFAPPQPGSWSNAPSNTTMITG